MQAKYSLVVATWLRWLTSSALHHVLFRLRERKVPTVVMAQLLIHQHLSQVEKTMEVMTMNRRANLSILSSTQCRALMIPLNDNDVMSTAAEV